MGEVEGCKREDMTEPLSSRQVKSPSMATIPLTSDKLLMRFAPEF